MPNTSGFKGSGITDPFQTPDAPAITGVSTQAEVSFTAPADTGGAAIDSYVVTAKNSSTNTSTAATGSASPITVSGLSGTTNTFSVQALNKYGAGQFSGFSNSTYIPFPYQIWTIGGYNGYGCLGQNDAFSNHRSSPIQIGALNNWSDMSSSYHSLASKLDGTLWAWGKNSRGSVGDGTQINRSSPVQIGALTTWDVVEVGQNMSIAIKSDGTLWTWGANSSGELGHNNRTYRSSPVQVGADTNWAIASGGRDHSFFVKSTGELYACGINSSGRLGLNDTINRSSPTQVGADTNWGTEDQQIATSDDLAAAIKSDGTLWTWGDNANGALGHNTPAASDTSSPVQVGALTNWSKVSVGSGCCMAVKTDGTLWSWGSNSSGRGGRGDTVAQSSPVQIGALTTWASPRASTSMGGAVKTDGTLWTWGAFQFGVRGRNGAPDASSPVQVGSDTNWYKLTGTDSAVMTALKKYTGQNDAKFQREMELKRTTARH